MSDNSETDNTGVGLERFDSTDWAGRAEVKNKESVRLRGHTGTKNSTKNFSKFI